VQVLVLGPLEVVDDNGVVVPLSGARIRALTALLALDAGHVVSTDRLIDCLYGDQLPQGAANALQLQISRLRRALRPAGGAIATRPPGYVLELEAEQVDALRLVRLVAEARAARVAGEVAQASALLHRALDLWRGEALADFAYDEFASGERARLAELRLSVLEDCVEVDLDLGRHVECADQLERLVAAHPLRERLWSALMLALYRSGRQAESLRAFQDARGHLGDELGIEPGPELQRMESAVLSQDPSLDQSTAAPVARQSPGNLVRPLTTCIGREDELAAVHGLLGVHRLVTLIGPGGTGKTRLAVEVGLTRNDDSPVWVVDLASVADGTGVLPAVRSALGPAASAGLVLLDNCEHVVADAAAAAADLVAGCPRLRILATSRERLGVPGEVLYSVPPLSQDAAVVLFEERARASAPGISLDDTSSVAVARICRRLDGLPLAIELAAARVRALDVAQIAARLDDRFRLLSTGPRTLLPRQRTLRAVVDWSYDLLDADERLLFERLSVFAGPAPLEAVEAVCASDGIEDDDIALVLSRLVDKSLVVVTPAPKGNRYSMLQTLGEYAGEKLGRGELVRGRHARWVLGVVRDSERGAGGVPSVSLAELDAVADDIDAALVWARDAEPALAFELAARLGWFWFWTGRIDVGWQALSSSLEGAVEVPGELGARALAWGGMLGAVMQADGAPALLERAVAVARDCGHLPTLGQALALRGALHVLRGDPATASAELAEAACCYSAAGDRHGQGMVSMVQGLAAVAEGRLADAGVHYERSMRQLDAAGDDWAAGVSRQRVVELAEQRDAAGSAQVPSSFSQALIRAQLAGAHGRTPVAGTDALALAVADHIRGRMTLRQNRPDEARSDLELALRGYRAQGHSAAVASCLGDLGRIASALGDDDRAVRLHAEATAAAVGTADAGVVLSALEGLTAALVATGDARRAGLALGAADALRDAGATAWDLGSDDDRGPVEAAAAALLGDGELHGMRAEGRALRVEDLLDQLVA
jgi:predicted ATPase/DNA-binding SARP family transcriptional activator